MKLLWTEQAWKEYVDWQTTDRAILNKINQIIQDILRNGNDGIGQAEPLMYELSGLWSRRINKQHRVVYYIGDDIINIVSCCTHYESIKR